MAFHVNEGSTNYWLSLLVEFEDGDGDVGSMHIRPVCTIGRTLILMVILILKNNYIDS